MSDVVVIGAGPAGLTAAHELARLGYQAVVLEQSSAVGGLARTVVHNGYRFDVGGHRFFSKVPYINELWHQMLGDDFLCRRRVSWIYYKDRLFDYPLKPLNALRGLGPVETARVFLSFVRARISPSPVEDNFEQWMVNRFGRRLFEIFFKEYTEKVWGMPCTEIAADWAAQRIQKLDLLAAAKNAFLGPKGKPSDVVTTLIDRFHYPRLGPGMMWESCRRKLERNGTQTLCETEVVGLHHHEGRIVSARVRFKSGEETDISGDHFISSMPLDRLIRAMDPPPPGPILEAAARLRHRAFITVGLIVDREEVFPGNWIYVHSPQVKVARIQNYRSWSPDMVPEPGTTSLGLEYFADRGDALWCKSDAEMVRFGTAECEALSLLRADEVMDGVVIRVSDAYPVYDPGFKKVLGTIRRWLDGFSNLQVIGRNGQHRYNNQDHAMLTGIYAARNLAGAEHDVWSVNAETEYLEDLSPGRDSPSGEVLGRVERDPTPWRGVRPAEAPAVGDDAQHGPGSPVQPGSSRNLRLARRARCEERG